ncbi:VQ motif-containing protein 11-like [Apium graveolens]|uniref:VQ motif-containing protein 11-like n=1 Tax=Apium graveolens TaxID=4045 RepID=UPI003D7A39A1
MASSSSSSSPKPNNNKSPQLENAICVHVDPSNYHDVVQKLTGARPAVEKLPITTSPHFNAKHNPVNVGAVRPSFKLQEPARNLQLQLNQNGLTESAFAPRKRVINVSPVSTLDTVLARGSPSPGTSVSPFVPVEEIAMANKGFYLYPSPPASTASKPQPQFLPLFPTSPDS